VLPDLDRLIRLQALDARAAEARRLQTSIPETQRALDQKLDGARQAVVVAKEQLAANQTSRRALDKDIAAIQTRLSRYKDQLMEVKTNREYHAMQHEIETAQGEVKRIEDDMLELMVAGDEIAATLKASEAGLKTAEQQITRERADLDRQLVATSIELEEVVGLRTALAREIPPKTLEQYEQVAISRRGVAVAQARDGLCSGCHVRLRPMVYAEVRHNSGLVQCDHCQRFLYFVPPPQPEAAPASA
jgi:predicted  nucleic acid-binding Zn-ribbon protein